MLESVSEDWRAAFSAALEYSQTGTELDDQEVTIDIPQSALRDACQNNPEALDDGEGWLRSGLEDLGSSADIQVPQGDIDSTPRQCDVATPSARPTSHLPDPRRSRGVTQHWAYQAVLRLYAGSRRHPNR